MHIHIEGMDLAGKTTCAQGLAASYGGEWNIRQNSLSDDNPIYQLADKLRKLDAYTPAIVGHLYVVALMADIHGFQSPQINTIQDSTVLLRSLAYHTVSGNTEITEALGKVLRTHPDFDHTFILTASLEARRERLEKRQREQPDEVAPDDLMVIKRPEKFLAMEKQLVELAQTRFRSTLIDTTYMTPKMVVDNVRAILDKREQQV